MVWPYFQFYLVSYLNTSTTVLVALSLSIFSDLDPTRIPWYSIIFFLFFCDNNHKWVLFLDLCLHRIPRTHQSRALAGVVASVGRDTGHGTPEHHSQLSVGSQPDNTWSHVALRPPLGNPPPSDKMSEPKLTKFALGTMFLQASVNYLFS